MKEIQLTKGQVALVDDEDFEWLSQHKWHALRCGNKYYAARTEPLYKIDGKWKKRCILMHRAILGLEHGDSRTGDHKEPSETLNNQRSNLRIATQSQQNANTRVPSHNTTGLKGVSKIGTAGYISAIRINGKRKYLGFRKTPEAAHALYAEAAKELFGEFARTA